MSAYTLEQERDAQFLSRSSRALLYRKEGKAYEFERMEVVHQEVRHPVMGEEKGVLDTGYGDLVAVVDRYLRVVDITKGHLPALWKGRIRLFLCFERLNSGLSEEESFVLCEQRVDGRWTPQLRRGFKTLGFMTEHQPFEEQLLKRGAFAGSLSKGLIRLLESNPEPVDDLLDQAFDDLVQIVRN